VPNLNVFRSDVAGFFQPSIDCIVKAVLEQKKTAHKTISVSIYTSFIKYRFPYISHLPNFQHVVLVGGFAANDWLFNQVQELLTPTGLNIVRPENHV
jgi:tRNA A37 threonylcarbamoyltransferase TsaD